MTKLLKRKSRLSWSEFCNRCHNLLIIRKSVAYGENYWCPKCKDWRYPEHYRQKKKGPKIEPEVIPLDTTKMKIKIDEYETKFFAENKGKITVYTSESYSEEFLLSLIPKR